MTYKNLSSQLMDQLKQARERQESVNEIRNVWTKFPFQDRQVRIVFVDENDLVLHQKNTNKRNEFVEIEYPAYTTLVIEEIDRVNQVKYDITFHVKEEKSRDTFNQFSELKEIGDFCLPLARQEFELFRQTKPSQVSCHTLYGDYIEECDQIKPLFAADCFYFDRFVPLKKDTLSGCDE